MREKDWINITEPNGKQKIASPEYIKALLGIERLPDLINRIIKLEQKVSALEKPINKKQILKLLENHEAHNKVWIDNRIAQVSWYDTYNLIEELVREGNLQVTKSGSQNMYSIKEK